MDEKSGSFVSRRLLVSWLWGKDPTLTDAQVNRALEALTAEEDRHALRDASYYRRLWRRGMLPPPPPTDPRSW